MLDQKTNIKIIDLVEENFTTSATGRRLLPTPIYIKIAALIGGNYASLNKFQKEIFRIDCANRCVRDFEYYINL